MDDRVVIPLPLLEQDMKEHVLSKGRGRCQYIRDLIRKDMEEGTQGVSQELKQYIEDYIKNNFGVMEQKTKEASLEQFKGAIDDIFNMNIG